jgi:hypothetical protein
VQNGLCLHSESFGCTFSNLIKEQMQFASVIRMCKHLAGLHKHPAGLHNLTSSGHTRRAAGLQNTKEVLSASAAAFSTGSVAVGENIAV